MAAHEYTRFLYNKDLIKLIPKRLYQAKTVNNITQLGVHD